ncbi:hypothetical protein ACS0TY_016514 [Phlomoides rotata]
MALSRILSQSLPGSSLRPSTALFTHHRHRSNKTHHAQLIEAEIESSSSPSDSPEEVINFGIKKLEDAIHSIIVRRSAPDWLPFLPGYSYWVPPRPSAMRSSQSHPATGLVEALGKFASTRVVRDRSSPLDFPSEDEQLASNSSKGWPSSAFFIEGTLPVQNNEDEANSSNSEDEEE